MAFKYTIDDGLAKDGFEIVSFKASTAFNDQKRGNDIVNLFYQLTKDEVPYYEKFGLKLAGKYTPDLIAKALQQKDMIYIIKQRGNTRVGLAVTAPCKFEKCYTIMGVIIAPEFRGKGLGKKLMKHVIDSRPEETPILGVAVGNPVAVKLYESLGFVPYDMKMIRKTK